MADKVVLRRWKSSKDLIALFPESPGDIYGTTINSYMNVGQHGEADYDHVVRQSTPVLWWSEDVMALLEELKRIGYEPDVVMKRTPQMRNARRTEALRLRSIDHSADRCAVCSHYRVLHDLPEQKCQHCQCGGWQEPVNA